eukprot:scaffold63984_cov61-Cyclotella_meneghiniana.AAC.2
MVSSSSQSESDSASVGSESSGENNDSVSESKEEELTIHVASALNCLGVLHYHANSSDNDDDSEEPTKDRLEGSSTDKAMELLQQALSLRKQCLGPNHVDVATTLNNIGRIHVQRDRFNEALGYYQDALHIRRVCLVTDS